MKKQHSGMQLIMPHPAFSVKTQVESVVRRLLEIKNNISPGESGTEVDALLNVNWHS